MIFATVGTQEPFDRLVRVVDELAGTCWKGEQVFIQAGDGAYIPRNAAFSSFLDNKEFSRLFSSARLVVGHAGTGTIISALVFGKPVVVMPRLAQFGEHRNDHQLATARKFGRIKLVSVAFDEMQLRTILSSAPGDFAEVIPAVVASPGLLRSIRNFCLR